MDLGLVEDVVKRNTKHISGHYIRVRYLTLLDDFPTPSKTRRVAKQGDKCLEIISNKYLDTSSGGSGNRHKQNGFTKFDKNASSYLHNIILSTKNLNLDTRQWPNTFRLLRTKDGADKKRIAAVLKWYAKNIGGDYIPVAHCAKTFRQKFGKLEEAIARQNHTPVSQPVKKSGIVYRDHEDPRKAGFYDEEER
jgi:hypothetical protein